MSKSFFSPGSTSLWIYVYIHIYVYIYTQVWYAHSPNWASSWLIWMPRTQGSKISCIHPNQILILYAAIILQCLSFEGPINMKWLPWHAENLVPRPMLDRWNEIHGLNHDLLLASTLPGLNAKSFWKEQGHFTNCFLSIFHTTFGLLI